MAGLWCTSCNKGGHNVSECWGPGTVAVPATEPAFFGLSLGAVLPTARPVARVTLTPAQEDAIRRKWRRFSGS